MTRSHWSYSNTIQKLYFKQKLLQNWLVGESIMQFISIHQSKIIKLASHNLPKLRNRSPNLVLSYRWVSDADRSVTTGAYLLRRNRATQKLNQMLTKDNFLIGAVNQRSKASRPRKPSDKTLIKWTLRTLLGQESSCWISLAAAR